MAQYDQGVQLARTFLRRAEPVNSAGYKNADRSNRLNQGQVTRVADTAAMFRAARVRVFRSEPDYLRRQDAV